MRAAHNVPALAAVLVHRGQIVERAAVGRRSVDHPEQVGIDDRWHIGSLTKAMTGTLAGILVERGELTWETTVADLFPEWVTIIQAQYRDATVAELVSHTSGLPVDVTRAPSLESFDDAAPGTIGEKRRQWALEMLQLAPAGPRGRHVYSNAGYLVAGAMIERLTGESWEELLRRELFGPLGMVDSGFGAPGAPGVRSDPWGHWPSGSGWTTLSPGPDADNPAAIGPAGTVHTTLSDYARYMADHIAGERGTDGIVSAATFRALHTPAPGTDYGAGWGASQRSWADGLAYGHAGSNTRWFAWVWLAPNRDFGMFAVTNAGGDRADEASNGAVVLLLERFEAAFGGG